MKDILYYVQLLAESAVAVFGVRPYEEPRYDVLATLPNRVEIRRYAERVAAEASAPGEGKQASAQAFRTLFRYIAGREKVAMTTPVATQAAADGVRMRFFLPERYTAQSAPAPADARVRIVALPAQTLATLRFSGDALPAEVVRREAELLAALDAGPWKVSAAPVLLVYDPPFTLPFLRRNEIALEVERR
jgi:SOUL heme-binding protein